MTARDPHSWHPNGIIQATFFLVGIFFIASMIVSQLDLSNPTNYAVRGSIGRTPAVPAVIAPAELPVVQTTPSPPSGEAALTTDTLPWVESWTQSIGTNSTGQNETVEIGKNDEVFIQASSTYTYQIQEAVFLKSGGDGSTWYTDMIVAAQTGYSIYRGTSVGAARQADVFTFAFNANPTSTGNYYPHLRKYHAGTGAGNGGRDWEYVSPDRAIRDFGVQSSISDDGSIIALGFQVSGVGPRVLLFGPTSNIPIATLSLGGTGNILRNLSVSGDGKRLVASGDNWMKIYNLDTPTAPVDTSYSLPSGTGVRGHCLAISRGHRVVFVDAQIGGTGSNNYAVLGVVLEETGATYSYTAVIPTEDACSTYISVGKTPAEFSGDGKMIAFVSLKGNRMTRALQLTTIEASSPTYPRFQSHTVRQKPLIAFRGYPDNSPVSTQDIASRINMNTSGSRIILGTFGDGKALPTLFVYNGFDELPPLSTMQTAGSVLGQDASESGDFFIAAHQFKHINDFGGIEGSIRKYTLGVNPQPPLPAPGNLIVTDGTCAGYDMCANWNAVSGAQYYEVWMGMLPDFTQSSHVFDTPNLGTAIPILAHNTIHHVWVRAVREGNPGAFSTDTGYYTGTLAGLPRNVRASTNQAGQITLRWNAPATGPAPTSYRITPYVFGSGGSVTPVTVTGTTYTHPVSPGYAMAFDIMSIVNGVNGGIVFDVRGQSIGTGSPASSPFATLAPTNLTTSASGSGITLSWSPLAGAEYYMVYRATQPNQSPQTLVGFSTQSTVLDASAPVGQTLYYRVVAYSADHPNPYEHYFVASLASADAIGIRPLEGVVGLLATKGNASDITVTWNAVIGSPQYQVFASTTGTLCEGSPVHTTSATTYVDTITPAQSVRNYSVRAVAGTNVGPCSNLDFGFKGTLAGNCTVAGSTLLPNGLCRVTLAPYSFPSTFFTYFTGSTWAQSQTQLLGTGASGPGSGHVISASTGSACASAFCAQRTHLTFRVPDGLSTAGIVGATLRFGAGVTNQRNNGFDSIFPLASTFTGDPSPPYVPDYYGAFDLRESRALATPVDITPYPALNGSMSFNLNQHGTDLIRNPFSPTNAPRIRIGMVLGDHVDGNPFLGTGTNDVLIYHFTGNVPGVDVYYV